MYKRNCFVVTNTLGDMMYGELKVYKLPQSHCGDNQEGTLFLWLHFMITWALCVSWITHDLASDTHIYT